MEFFRKQKVKLVVSAITGAALVITIGTTLSAGLRKTETKKKVSGTITQEIQAPKEITPVLRPTKPAAVDPHPEKKEATLERAPS